MQTSRGFCILSCFSAAALLLCDVQAGAPGTGKTTFIQNLASAYGSQDEGASLGFYMTHTSRTIRDRESPALEPWGF